MTDKYIKCSNLKCANEAVMRVSINAGVVVCYCAECLKKMQEYEDARLATKQAEWLKREDFRIKILKEQHEQEKRAIFEDLDFLKEYTAHCDECNNSSEVIYVEEYEQIKKKYLGDGEQD